MHDIDGLVQDCSNSIANALELLQFCTKPSISSILNIALIYNEISLGYISSVIIVLPTAMCWNSAIQIVGPKPARLLKYS